MPEKVIFVDELPIGATGKVLKNQLRDAYGEVLMEDAGQAALGIGPVRTTCSRPHARCGRSQSAALKSSAAVRADGVTTVRNPSDRADSNPLRLSSKAMQAWAGRFSRASASRNTSGAGFLRRTSSLAAITSKTSCAGRFRQTAQSVSTLGRLVVAATTSAIPRVRVLAIRSATPGRSDRPLPATMSVYRAVLRLCGAAMVASSGPLP